MKQKVLKTGILLFFCGMLLPVYAQQSSKLEGNWVLDSVRVKEVVPDEIIEKTILPGERWKFDGVWMTQFKVNGDSISYVSMDGHTYADNSYSLQFEERNIFTIYGVPDVKTYTMQMIDKNHLLLLYSFSGGYRSKPIDIFWVFYYSKK